MQTQESMSERTPKPDFLMDVRTKDLASNEGAFSDEVPEIQRMCYVMRYERR